MRSLICSYEIRQYEKRLPEIILFRMQFVGQGNLVGKRASESVVCVRNNWHKRKPSMRVVVVKSSSQVDFGKG